MTRRSIFHAFLIGALGAQLVSAQSLQQERDPLKPDGRGRAVFDAPVVVVDEFHRFEYLYDTDGDVYPDVFGWWWTDDNRDQVRLKGWTNAGDGTFDLDWLFVLTLGVSDANKEAGSVVGDLNGDGLDDFGVAFGQHVWLYTTHPTSTPSPYAIIELTSFIESIAMADFDQDGLADLAIYDDDVRIYLNEGRDQMVLSQDYDFHSNLGDKRLVVVDANGDATPDLMMNIGLWITFFEITDGVITGHHNVMHDVGSDEDNLCVPGDIDGDGDVDVAVFQPETGECSILRRTGPDTFDAEPMYIGGPATGFADVDGDGDPDGVCCGGGGDGYTRNVWASRYEISINDGNGGFAPAVQIPNVGAHHLAGAADIDRDGDIDLVGGRTVYYGRAGDDFSSDPPFADELVTQGFSDYDGDGDPDYEVGVAGVTRNLGDGSFTATPITVPDPPENRSWKGPGYPGDWDGDGDEDLLVSVVSGFFGLNFHSMRLLENNGAGAFFDAGDAAAPGEDMNASSSYRDQPWLMLSADIDQDGDLDFCTKSLTTRVYFNDGAGFFTPGPTFPEKIQWVGDLDGDTISDLVLITDKPYVRLGLGGGAFGAATVIDSPLGSGKDVAVGDMDDDGDVDILSVEDITGRIKLHLNDGSANFTTTQPFPLSRCRDGSAFAAAVDVDADGRKDIVVGPLEYASNSTFLFLRKENGGWHDPVSQTMLPTGFADVDGDGDLDATTDVRFTNRSIEAPNAGRRIEYGAGSQGICSTLPPPTLGATGPFRLGETIEYRMCGAEMGSIGLLTFGLAPSSLLDTPYVGVTTLNWPWSASEVFVVTDGDGVLPAGGVSRWSTPVDTSLIQHGSIYSQAFFTNSCRNGVSSTNGLRIDFEL